MFGIEGIEGQCKRVDLAQNFVTMENVSGTGAYAASLVTKAQIGRDHFGPEQPQAKGELAIFLARSNG